MHTISNGRPGHRASALVAVLGLALVAAPFAASATEPESGDAPDYHFSTDWTGPHTGLWLRHLARFMGKPDVHGLEVGCFEGRSTIWFLERIANGEGSTMDCIDVFTPAIEERFDHNIAVAGFGDRMRKHKGYSQDVLRTLDVESFDFIYIDGCHLASCVLTDAVLSWDLLKPGGMIIFDDYLWNLEKAAFERPKVAIDAFLTAFQPQLRVRERGHQVIIEKLEPRSDEDLVGSPVVHSEEWESEYEKHQEKD
ncbi:MAG TPA: class I SAM-dependent methyltransferase [Myxococcota bacterium]|nr:class I SAM-dependent methyltransferase [Myxococcota bacterium]